MRNLILGFLILVVGVMSAQAEEKSEFKQTKKTYVYSVVEGDSLRMDHYIAQVDGKRPCVIFLFGGGFVGGVRDKQNDIPFFEFLQSTGYDVFSIDYRLGMKDADTSGIVGFFKALDNSVNIAVEDLFSATNYILEHADEWQIDREKVITCGSSAGAITVLQGKYYASNKMPLSQVLPDDFKYAGVISFAGAIFTLEGAPDWKQEAAPILLFHGNADRQVPYNKIALFGRGMYGSKYIADKLHQRDRAYWFYSVEYETHDMASSPMHENRDEILIFLEEFVIKRRHLQRSTHIVDASVPECRTFFLPTDYINSNY